MLQRRAPDGEMAGNTRHRRDGRERAPARRRTLPGQSSPV